MNCRKKQAGSLLNEQQTFDEYHESIVFQNSQAPIFENCELCLRYYPKIKSRIFHKVGSKILHYYREHKHEPQKIEFVSRLQQIALDYQKQIRKEQS